MSQHVPVPGPCRLMLVLGVTALAATLCLPSTSVWGAGKRPSPIVTAVAQARPAVVSIHGRKRVGEATLVDSSGARQVNGMGTGVLIDERGYILTNHHVVEGVERIQVTLADERTLIARLIAHDAATDLAVIKVDADAALPVIPIGSSSDLMPGETVVAVGNAYGYDHTVTSGIISALHRPVQVSEEQRYSDLIQTDASINPGNSGGPLLNIDGQMIGINVAVRVGAQGIGFAIPVNEAMRVAAELLTVERIDRRSHGVLGTSVDEDGESYFEVRSTRSGSPAERGGLRAGDIVTQVDDVPIARALDFERALIGRQEGEEVRVTVKRGNETLSLSLVMDSAQRIQSGVEERTWNLLGVRLSPVSQRVIRQMNARYRGGLQVVSVKESGPAERQGIRRGDILVGMHLWETVSLENMAYILNSAEFRQTQPARFYILRDGETLFGEMQVAFEQ